MNSFIQPYDLTALITDHLLGTSKTKHKRKKNPQNISKGNRREGTSNCLQRIQKKMTFTSSEEMKDFSLGLHFIRPANFEQLTLKISYLHSTSTDKYEKV